MLPFPSWIESKPVGPEMHTHIGAIAAITTMIYIALLGTFWRLLAAHAVASDSPTFTELGKAMLFQY